jgi:hypothetical protein
LLTAERRGYREPASDPPEAHGFADRTRPNPTIFGPSRMVNVAPGYQLLVWFTGPVHQPQRYFGAATGRNLVRCIGNKNTEVVFSDRVARDPLLPLPWIADNDVCEACSARDWASGGAPDSAAT